MLARLVAKSAMLAGNFTGNYQINNVLKRIISIESENFTQLLKDVFAHLVY
jgi:hypothetical protein